MDNLNLEQKLQRVKILVMDVDGTMTDSKVYYSARGEEFKAFSIRDGMGIELLRRAGLQAAILTSENSEIVTARARKLKIDHVLLGSRSKLRDLEGLAEKSGINLDEIAYIGDDVNDIQAMQACGVKACPKDAVEAVKAVCNYISDFNGGSGAVRQLIERILISQNKSIVLPTSW